MPTTGSRTAMVVMAEMLLEVATETEGVAMGTMEGTVTSPRTQKTTVSCQTIIRRQIADLFSPPFETPHIPLYLPI